MIRPVRLYCFPHSGATTSVYRSWQQRLGPDLVIRPIDRPGRGRLGSAPVAGSLDELVARSAAILAADLAEDPGAPWMTFGHSFGSVLAVATASAVDIGRPPLAAIVSAGLPPPSHSPVDEAAGLSDQQVRDAIVEIGGTPPALLEPGPMRDQIIRCFREDHASRAEFRRLRDLKVEFPLGIVAADQDPYAPPAAMDAWAEHSTAVCPRRTVPGGHFALMRDPGVVRELVHRLRDGRQEGQAP